MTVEAAHGRAGRNLPAAIVVGAALGALLVLLTLYADKPVFVGVVVAAIGYGVWEVARSLRVADLRVPIVPLLAGTVGMVVMAYRRGPEDLVVALLLTVLAVVVWRLADGAPGYLNDVAAGAFTAVYVPFLAGFAALLTAPPDGPRRATIFIATVVASDVGGYAAGVLFGKHPMAPTVSPKKSWEGFVGSALACMLCAGVMVPTLLHGAVWQGVVVGAAVTCSATLGDLGESMIKRDLGIKDMGTLLPGHGGIMDRLDSLLTDGAGRVVAAHGVRAARVTMPATTSPPRHLADLTWPTRTPRARCRALGEPAYRADQLSRHYFVRLGDETGAMTDVPAAARDELASAFLPPLLDPGATPRVRRRHDPQDVVAPARRRARRVGADALSGPDDGVRLEPGRLRDGLPVLRDRAGRASPATCRPARSSSRWSRRRACCTAASWPVARPASATSSSWAWVSRSPTTPRRSLPFDGSSAAHPRASACRAGR